jgi:hypothetical protein
MITEGELQCESDYINICVVIFVSRNITLYCTQVLCNKWFVSDQSNSSHLFLHFYVALCLVSKCFSSNLFVFSPDVDHMRSKHVMRRNNTFLLRACETINITHTYIL